MLAAWISACAVACSLDVDPLRPEAHRDSGPRDWQPASAASRVATRARSRTDAILTTYADASLDDDAGELGNAAVRLDAAMKSAHDPMPSTAPRECEPGVQKCDGNAAVMCTSNGSWSNPAACGSSRQCVDGLCTDFPSCVEGGRGRSDCGDGSLSCCDSPLIPSGSYYRSYVSSETGSATELAAPATVSSFRLDKYEVTVGRFRQFVAAWRAGAGYTPKLSAGRHEHLHEGRGLRVVGGAYEPGWTDTNMIDVAPTDVSLNCDPESATWTPAPADAERLPITCVRWAEAAAFCIWDGGFLPSESEWEYAAAGGDEQRRYPWGAAAPGVSSEYAIYGCLYPSGEVLPGSAVGVCDGGNLPPVGTAKLGVARWGQLDLGGGVWEWALDSSGTDSLSQSYLARCTDCVDLTPAPQRLVRGGQYENSNFSLQPNFRKLANAMDRYPGVGFRCAKPP